MFVDDNKNALMNLYTFLDNFICHSIFYNKNSIINTVNIFKIIMHSYIY
jgi:hypothetical protein